MYGKIVNVPYLDNFLLQHLKMSRIKAQNAYWRNENVVLQIDLINMQSLIRSCILENSIHYWQSYWVVKQIAADDYYDF